MTNQEIKNKVVSIITDQLGIDKETITDSSTLESLGADSVDRFEFVIKIEEDFHITINDEDADSLNTLDQVVSYIEKQLQ